VADEVFDEADGPYCDLALWLRVALRSDVGFLADPLSGYRVHVGSASSGFKTLEQVLGRTVLTLHHADALQQAHGRFVERPELDPQTAAEFARLQRDSDRRIRLAIRINRLLPPPLLKAAKRLLRWGRRGRLYSTVSLYSAYAPEAVSDGTRHARQTPALLAAMEADVCIVGAGPAGLATACALIDSAARSSSSRPARTSPIRQPRRVWNLITRIPIPMGTSAPAAPWSVAPQA
jgi:hypothetical protein